jgi:NitT/TauT family transport system substrate-binding protein
MDLARAVLVDEGIDPNTELKFVPLPGFPYAGQVIDTKQMAEALHAGEIQAIWNLDINYALFAAEGIFLTRLPAPRSLDRLSPASCLFTNDAFLSSHSGVLAKFGRSLARATLFAFTNPEAAIRLLWNLEPKARPTAEGAPQALERDLASLRTRLENQRFEKTRVPRWGAISREEVSEWQEFLLRTKAISHAEDPLSYFEESLVDSFNDFSAERVICHAREFRA